MILTYYMIQEASKFCQIPSVYPRKDPLIITKVFRKFQIFYSSGGYIKLFQKIIGIDPCLCSALRIAGRTKNSILEIWNSGHPKIGYLGTLIDENTYTSVV